MGQVGLTKPIDNRELFITECPRKDCRIQGTTAEPFGATKLLPEFQHLLGPVKIG